MKNLKIKSDDNYDAFLILIKNNKCCPSIHCAYYSAYLLSIYSLCSKFGYSYEDIQKESKGTDSHFYVRNELYGKIESLKRLDAVDFNVYMGKLKMMRKKADYSKDLITGKEANDTKDAIEKLRELVTSKYI